MYFNCLNSSLSHRIIVSFPRILKNQSYVFYLSFRGKLCGWLKNGSDTVDFNRFQSHTGIEFNS